MLTLAGLSKRSSLTRRRGLYAALVRGDHELNLIKMAKAIGVSAVQLATDEAVSKQTNAPVGFIGPVQLEGVVGVIGDLAIEGLNDAVCGANDKDTHLTGVSAGRDFIVDAYVDLRLAKPGDECPRCHGTLDGYRGIEVGHVFFLGTKYSESMGCTYLDESGVEKPMVMGCYGIGVSRIMAAAIEQNHDEYGIVWPASIAPFHLTILPLQMNKDEVVDTATALYEQCANAGIEVLLDDRNERAGSKFKDADLLGIPYRITIGSRGLANGVVEAKYEARPMHWKCLSRRC